MPSWSPRSSSSVCPRMLLVLILGFESRRGDIFRAFFGSIPEGYGNYGESTITKSPMRNKQWQKHRGNIQPKANRMTVLFFFLRNRNRGMGTGILPREFSFETKWLKWPWLYHGSYFVKVNKITVIRFAVVRSLILGFCHCLFDIRNFVMVDSPRFPKSSAIDPEKALQILTGKKKS